MIPTFEILLDKNDFFRFNLLGHGKEILLKSESYTTLPACENGISSVIKNGTTESNYDIKISTNQKYYLTLKSKNGQIIGTSNLYKSKDKLNQVRSTIIHILNEGVQISNVKR